MRQVRGARRISTWAAAVVAAGSLLAGCGGSDASAGDDQVVVALTTFASDTALSWNAVAADQAVYDQVYDTLVDIGDDGQAAPSLAESWDVSEDGLTYTFHLRSGVPFHKGYGDLTSADVVFTANKWLDPASTGGVAQVMQTYVSSVEAPDEHTVVMTLKAANPTFDTLLGNQAWILSQKYVEEVGEEKAAREPVGTGPFEFAAADGSSEKRFTRVKGHFAHDASYDSLVLRQIPDVSTQLSALEAGEVDVIQVVGDNIERAESGGNQVLITPGATQSWVVLPGLSAPGTGDYRPELPWVGDASDEQSLKNARLVRHALAMAIDKDAIVDSIYGGAGDTDAFGYAVREGFPGWSPDWKPLPYDPDGARELLTEAGFPDGFTIKLVDTGQTSDTSAVVQAVGQYWDAIGIDVELSKLDVATAITNNQSRSKKADYAIVYSVAGSLTLSSINGFASTGAFRFLVNDDRTDAEIAAIAAATDPDERARLITTTMSRLVDEQYGLQLATKGAAFAVSDRIDDWTRQVGNGEPNNYQYLTLAD